MFALACVALSAAGHVAASGQAVPLWSLGAAWLGVFAVAMALAGRERSQAGITTCLLAGQLALHTLFTLDRPRMPAAHRHAPSDLELVAGRLLCGLPADASGHRTLPHGADAAGIVRHAGLDPSAYSDAPATTADWCANLSSASPMLIGHLLAALAAGWFLRRGEAALWRLVRLTARAAEVSAFPLHTALALLRALLRGLDGAPAAGSLAPTRGDQPAEASVLLQHCVVRRGPPEFALAA
jgi:hypothetical protein